MRPDSVMKEVTMERHQANSRQRLFPVAQEERGFPGLPVKGEGSEERRAWVPPGPSRGPGGMRSWAGALLRLLQLVAGGLYALTQAK